MQREINEKDNYYIYYILLENRKFYVTNYKTRLMTIDDIKATTALSGPDWLLINRPICVIKIIESDPLNSMEDYVINFMSIEGIKNVRGSVYINTQISSETESIITSKMKTTYIPIKFGDYVEESEPESEPESESESESKTSLDIRSKSSNSFIYRAYRWFCFKKISNEDAKISLIE